MSAVLLGEKIRLIHVIILLLTLACVALLTINWDDRIKDDAEEFEAPPVLFVVGIYLAPFFFGSAAIMSNKLQNITVHQHKAYYNIILFVVSMVIVFIQASMHHVTSLPGLTV